MRRPWSLLLVFVGGALGAAGREAVEQAAPAGSGIPVATLAINLAGAFALGALLEALVRTGPDSGWRHQTRLLAGTGFLGGWTTYSTFSLEALQLLRHAHPGSALAYVALTVLGGLAAAGAGVVLSARVVAPSERGGGRGDEAAAVDPDL